MKKKIFGFLMLTALCVVTVVKVSVDRNSVTGLTLANIEALALFEDPDPFKYTIHDFKCYDRYGQETGKKRRSCMQTGFEESCTPHDCE